MILNGDEIIEEWKKGHIDITDFDPAKVGPNSYDVTLGDKLMVYTDVFIDPRRSNTTREIMLTDEGYIFSPGTFLLGHTHEYCKNDCGYLVPMIEGRSSVARLGISIHVTAGFGDIGFNGHWTLELTAAHPVVLRPRMPIGQLYWLRTNETDRRYKGKYQNQLGVMASKSYVDYAK